jgi:hypothetical protein
MRGTVVVKESPSQTHNIMEGCIDATRLQSAPIYFPTEMRWF